MKLTELSVSRRIATSVIVIALLVLGTYGLVRLPVNFLPNITYPMVKVHVWWRGATPDEIITNLADPIERQMATVDGLDYLESSSIEGMYTLLINFKYGVNLDVAYQDTLAAMARTTRSLPKDIDPPLVFKADPSQLPVVQITISSEQWDLVKLRTWADNWLQDQLSSIPGVAGTEIVGGLKREIRIHIDPNTLEKYSISLPTLIKRLQEENIEQFGGRVISGTKEFIARTVGEYRSLEDIRAVVITRNGDAKITLGEIAEIKDAYEEVRVITRLGGKPCVKLSVLKQADVNTVNVALAVQKRIKQLQPMLPAGIKLGMVENQADYVIPALKGVRNAALEAAVLVLIVIFLFLGSLRQVIMMIVVLPLTLIINFALMKIVGFSLNIFSLAGLVIAIGVDLDNSIVVLENITRLKHENPNESAFNLAVKGVKEVGGAMLAATLSFLALFIPFLIVPGLISLLFKELILVIAGIVCISLMIARTVTPMIISFLIGDKSEIKENVIERFFSWMIEIYGKVLSFFIKLRWIVIPVFLLLLGGAVWLTPKLGSEFLPAIDDGRVMIKVKLPTGAALSETDRILTQLESLIADDPLIESAFTLVGGKVWGLYTYEIANEGEIDIQLVPKHNRNISVSEYIKKLRPLAAKVPVPGGKAMVRKAKLKGIRKLGVADIEVKIKGQETGKLFELARLTAESMTGLKQLTNVYVSMDMSKPEYQIQVDRLRAAEEGISMTDIAATTRALISGAVAGKYREGDEYYNIRVMIPEDKITGRQDIENLILTSTRGGYLRLRDVAKTVHAVGPVEISREDQVKQVIVRGDAIPGVTVGQALSSLQNAMQKIKFPVGYEISYGGQAQMMAEMNRTISMILGFAIFFSFVVLAVQFNSLKMPLLILGSIPFCVAGMAYALYLTGLPMGATVLIGLLVVVASNVNGGVLLLTVAEEMRTHRQMSAVEAIIKASQMRFRPRMMIFLCVIAGLIPLALNIEDGGDMLQPMAAAAIGGLGLGIFVALFMVPCLYVAFDWKKEYLANNMGM